MNSPRTAPEARSSPPADERGWWLRALAVLGAPRAVFAALRDDSDEAAAARQEPITAIAFLAGIAALLATGGADELLDDPDFEGYLVPLWAVFGGAVQGLGLYWVGGLLLHAGGRALGSTGGYRQSRHLLAYALAPLCLDLVVVWPLRLLLHGGDTFRSAGSDQGVGNAIFEVAEAGLLAWSAGLLALGLAAVRGWSLLRASAAAAPCAAALALLVLGLDSFD